ncbi:hypothetical protein TRIP_C10041 [Candidatus Zixiibacteriota bacterium]|nr:hypothetical protein TRIP_C10041 [candidate division Zixibacteria bacterium]
MYLSRHYIRSLCRLILPVLLLLSCGDKSTNNATITSGDYHLIYGPVLMPDLKLHTYTYSTKTGERFDTSTGTDLYYSDFRFAAGGTIAAYTGWHQSLRSGPKVTWVTTYPAGDTVALKEGIGAKTLSLSADESELLLFGLYGFMLLSFPPLDSIYQDSIGIMGGFLTVPDKFYFLDTIKDTIYTIDYSNPESIQSGKKPLNLVDSGKVIAATAVDYNNHRLYILLSNHLTESSLIAVFDSDSLNLLKKLSVSRYLCGLSIYPNYDACYFFGNGAIGSERNQIDKYSFASNSLQPFLKNGDVNTPDPFQPRHIEFTPDGNEMFVLIAGGLWGPSPILGLNLYNKEITQYLKCDSGAISIFRINPIDYSK